MPGFLPFKEFLHQCRCNEFERDAWSWWVSRSEKQVLFLTEVPFFFFFSNGGSATCAQTPNFPTESIGDIIVCANLHANQRQHKWATDGFIWSLTFRAEFYAQMNARRYTGKKDLSRLIVCPLGSWDWPNTVFIKPDMHEQAMILIWYLLRAPSTFGHAPTVCRSGAFCITCLVELNCEVYVWRWQHTNISWCTIGNIKHSKP